ncbi:MAG: hypothetical protein ABFS08_08965 [Pseudomonadota bacterium]
MNKRNIYALSMAGLFVVACASVAAPFGGDDDVSYAARLWQQMESRNLVGQYALYSTPYKGAFPHGEYLDKWPREPKRGVLPVTPQRRVATWCLTMIG